MYNDIDICKNAYIYMNKKINKQVAHIYIYIIRIPYCNHIVLYLIITIYIDPYSK